MNFSRFLLLSLLLLFYYTGLAQAPIKYYKKADGLAGIELKKKLHVLIKDHTTFPYTSKNTDVWDLTKETEQDSLNPEHIILLYTGASVNGAQEYNGGNGWTREHTWPKSRGDFGTRAGAGTDMHHMTAETARANSTRNNRHFDWCTQCIPLMHNGDSTGSFYDAVQYSFLPRAEVRGDIARMMFYMAVRYEGGENEPDLELVVQYDTLGQRSKAPLLGNLETLLQWHEQDPVDARERRRNEVVFKYQGNRNPFIDFPCLVPYVFGAKQEEAWELPGKAVKKKR
ncbi:MAG: endonuclease I family protein [Luteibaculaceae bacterium]